VPGAPKGAPFFYSKNPPSGELDGLFVVPSVVECADRCHGECGCSDTGRPRVRPRAAGRISVATDSRHKLFELSAAEGGVQEPRHFPAFCIAAPAGQREIVRVVGSALCPTPQMLDRGGVRLLLCLVVEAENDKALAVAAAAVLSVKQP